MSTNKRGGFWKGVVFAGVAAAVGGGAIAYSGIVDVSARAAGGPPDLLLAYAAHQSIVRHAPKEPNPLAKDPAALDRGLELYRIQCAPCHGGPGLKAASFAAGLHPDAPDLRLAFVQAFTDGMLYRTVSEGIGSTGMPAFGASLKPDEIWSLVAAVRSLPQQTTLAGPPSGPEAGAGAAGAKGEHLHRVGITGFKFDPPLVEIAAGDEVEWTNHDFVAHTATADDKSFDTGTLDANRSRRIRFEKAGTLSYFCRFHKSMKGSVHVK